MADPVNPYMPSGLDRLSTMLMALGAGVSGAESQGRSGWAGIGPAAAMYGHANQQANQQAIQYAQWQQAHAEQQAYRQAQEENIRSQIDERKRTAGIDDKLMGMAQNYMQPGGGTPGFDKTQTPSTIGPGADLLKAGPQKVAYLTDKYGLSPVAAAGVVGNLYQESGFNPNATHDGGRGYGMAGWDPNRTAALNQFARMQGKSISDPQVQLDFVAHEGKNGDMGAQRAWAMLQTAKTPQDATTAMMHYFRPQGYTPGNPTAGHGYNNRVQYAQALVPGGAAPPNAQGQGDSAGGGSMPQQGPQMPGPPPDQRGLAPFMLRPHFSEFGKFIQSNQNKQDEYNWKAYQAEIARQKFEQDQRNQEVGPDGRPNTAKLDYTTESERRKMELERVPVIDSTTGQVVYAPKTALGNGNRPIEGDKLAMEKERQKATQLNQDVIPGPDGQPQVNQTLVGAKTAVSAAQGTDTTGKMLLGDYEAVRKAHTEIQDGALTARSGLAQTNRLEGLLNHLSTTGKFTSNTQQIKQMAKGIGIDLEALGIKDDTAPAQAVEAMRGQMALALRNPSNGAGMPGSMSDQDRKYLDRMVAGLDNTPEANKLIISASRKMYQRQIDLARISNDFMRSPEAKKDPNAIYQRLQDYAEKNPLFNEEDLPPPKAAPASPGGSLPMPNPDGSPRALRWNPAKGALE